jgi:hypothetical protein
MVAPPLADFDDAETSLVAQDSGLDSSDGAYEARCRHVHWTCCAAPPNVYCMVVAAAAVAWAAACVKAQSIAM